MLYKYCTMSGFDILLRSRIKVSRIRDLNDPFELMFGMQVKTAVDNIRNEYTQDPNILRCWRRLLNDQGIEYDASSVEDILHKIAVFQTKDIERVIQQIREYWNEKIGIVCFSRSMDVIQMWAHYAKNHRGIVVGIEEGNFEHRPTLVQVEYKDEMVSLPVTGNPKNLKQYENYFLEVLKRKESKWVYEEEYRIYVKLDEKDPDGNYYLQIPPSSIREVFLGLRSNEMAKIIAQSVKQRENFGHLRLYKMTRQESEYKLKPQEV